MADDHITRYEVMPIPPVASQTVEFQAGALSIGVEYRLLTDAIAARGELAPATGGASARREKLDDRGVSLHVFGHETGERLEYLRFDCFEEDPHYHYISWKDAFNHMVHLDPVADGDPVAWALERIRTRLPQMLERAGAADLARELQPGALDAILPRVTEAAFRARYHHDDAATLRAALGE